MRLSRALKLLSLGVAVVLGAVLVLTASKVLTDASGLPGERALAGEPGPGADAGPCGDGVKADTRAAQPGDGPSVSVACVDDDIVISVGTEGADPAAVNREIQESGANDGLLSSAIRKSFEAHALEVPNPFELKYDFDGTVEHIHGKVVFTIPKDQVRAEWDWWRQIVAGVIGYGIKYLTGAACIGAFAGAPTAAPFCAGLGAFFGGFTAALIESALSGQDLRNFQPWLRALAFGVLAGIGSGVWEKWVKPWAEVNAKPLLDRVGKAIKDAGEAVARWAGDSWRVAADAVGQAVQSAADHLYEALVEAARKAGYEVAADGNGSIVETGCGAPDLLQIKTSDNGSLCFANAGITDSYQIANVTNVSSGNNHVILRGPGVDYDLPRRSTKNLQNVTIDYIQIL